MRRSFNRDAKKFHKAKEAEIPQPRSELIRWEESQIDSSVAGGQTKQVGGHQVIPAEVYFRVCPPSFGLHSDTSQ